MPRAAITPHYTLCLNLSGMAALVIGGGAVAERKIRRLLRCGAVVSVVAPQACRAIRKWNQRGQVAWRGRAARVADLRGHRLVVCATDHPEVDQRMARAARRRGLLVNCASSPESGNFIVPATAAVGPIELAVSTGGSSPALSRKLVRDLASALGAQTPWVRLLQQLRPLVLERVPRRVRPEVLKQLASDEMAGLIRKGRTPAARKFALAAIARASCQAPHNTTRPIRTKLKK